MRFNKHFLSETQHAFLGASKYHWVDYDLPKMEKIWENKFKSVLGTREHKFAAEAITLRHKMKADGTTINTYINDGIGFRMTPEQVLWWSENFFGTADTIKFEKGVLRVHDLKTGVHLGNFKQLEIYAALFCLEYGLKPHDIEMIFRIYQSNNVFEQAGDPERVRMIMDKALTFDHRIEEMKELML